MKFPILFAICCLRLELTCHVKLASTLGKCLEVSEYLGIQGRDTYLNVQLRAEAQHLEEKVNSDIST